MTRGVDRHKNNNYFNSVHKLSHLSPRNLNRKNYLQAQREITQSYHNANKRQSSQEEIGKGVVREFINITVNNSIRIQH
jgi:hypothetical protein